MDPTRRVRFLAFESNRDVVKRGLLLCSRYRTRLDSTRLDCDPKNDPILVERANVNAIVGRRKTRVALRFNLESAGVSGVKVATPLFPRSFVGRIFRCAIRPVCS